ncbi:hypothetical protein CLM82_28295 [Streptomyces albidoflavus]|nr:hypothetical protein CLM82_28295 [Streptomyces albidoflavus]
MCASAVSMPPVSAARSPLEWSTAPSRCACVSATASALSAVSSASMTALRMLAAARVLSEVRVAVPV